MRAAIKAIAACALTVGLCACSQAAASEPTPPAPTEAPPTVQYQIFEDVNPYTGLPRGENYPAGRRGVAVMINNVRVAWPQSGLNAADLVYEIVTESGITRLMAVYRDYASMPTVGPLRSARDQHIQLMLPLDTLYAHIGSSAPARDFLEIYRYEDTKSIDGKYRNYYWIDADRRKTKGQEHCVYTNGETFSKAVDQYEMDTALEKEPMPVFDFVRYDEPKRELKDGEAKELYLRFSSYADAVLTYDSESGKYLKEQYDQPQLDMADEARQYGADNVFLLFVPIEKYPDGVLAHVRFDVGQGAGLYLNGGRYERVRWIKEAPASPLRIVDNNGNEVDVKVNPGTSYFALVAEEQIKNCRIDGKTLKETYNE